MGINRRRGWSKHLFLTLRLSFPWLATLGFGRMPLGEMCRVSHWRHRGQSRRPQTPTLPRCMEPWVIYITLYGRAAACNPEERERPSAVYCWSLLVLKSVFSSGYIGKDKIVLYYNFALNSHLQNHYPRCKNIISRWLVSPVNKLYYYEYLKFSEACAHYRPVKYYFFRLVVGFLIFHHISTLILPAFVTLAHYKFCHECMKLL